MERSGPSRSEVPHPREELDRLPDSESVVEPDIAWVNLRDYSEARPTATDVLLILEIAEASLAYDTGEKADLYASAGIQDYWEINIPDRSVEVRRDPGGGRYRSLRTFTGDEEVRPPAAPEIALRPSMVWPCQRIGRRILAFVPGVS